MSTKQKKGSATRSTKAAKNGASRALVVVARAARGPAKQARAALNGAKELPGEVGRFVKRNPVRVILGAAATAYVLAKLKKRFV
jgi:hypothetical protein